EESRALALRPPGPEGAVSVVERDAPPRPRRLSVGLERPGWEAELHFRVASRDRQSNERRHGGWIGPISWTGASLCIILAVGIPLMGSGSTPVRRERPRQAAAASLISPPAPVRAPRAQVAEAPPPVVSRPKLEARLEGVTLIGDKREA